MAEEEKKQYTIREIAARIAEELGSDITPWYWPEFMRRSARSRWRDRIEKIIVNAANGRM